MTSILCDLISDLHVEDVNEFNWELQPTSPFCIVAGDIARDRNVLKHTLAHLGQCYQQVFYIDGNEEHRNYYDNLDASYDHLTDMIAGINNVVYLRNDIVVLNGVAIIAANGWWTYDFESYVHADNSIDWFCRYVGATREQALNIVDRAVEDAAYLINSVQKVQLHNDIRSIVMVSHTLPCSWLINHDITLINQSGFNCMGNQHMTQAFGADLEDKIKMWCVGHYHHNIDRELNGVRYVSNVRGRANTPWFNHAFYPKRLIISD